MDNLTAHLNQLSETLNKRNAALKEVRLTLQKTEEERDENWRRLQLETREKRALTTKVKELSEALECSDNRLRQSESARKALAKTLQKFSLEKPEIPKLYISDPPQSLHDAYQGALSEVQTLTAKLRDERSKRLELKTAAKCKFLDHEQQISDLSTQLLALQAFADKADELATLKTRHLQEAVAESETLHVRLAELEDFKKHALKQWMLDRQISA